MGKRDRKRRAGGGGAPGGASSGAGSFADLGLDLDLEIEVPATARQPVGEGALVLRTALSPGTRAEYAALLKGERSIAAAAREDVWQRAVEFLFERLAVGWEVAGVLTEGPRPLLARFRAATREERTAVRGALRAHVSEHFPDLEAP